MRGRIFIRDLCTSCIVGVRAAERVNLQELKISVIIDAELDQAAVCDDLSATLDYAVLAERLTSYVQQRRALLLETLAWELGGLILNYDERVREVTVHLEKPAALQDAAGAGVEIIRTRP